MSALIERLLLPVSSEQPSGPDLSYDPRFDELETILKGKPEVDIGSVKRPAEPPDWRQLMENSAAFLEQSKHLRAAVMLSCSLLKTTGLPGFADGLRLIGSLVEQFWPTVYPLLDAEDNNDPTQRLNALISLTAPRGSSGSWLAIVDYLYTAPLCQPRGGPPITFEQIEAARNQEKGEGASPSGPDSKNLADAMRKAGKEAAMPQFEALQQSLTTLRQLDEFLTSTLGAGVTINFETLEKTLRDMAAVVGPYASESGENTAAEGVSPENATGQSGAVSVNGTIRSPKDVVRALETICEYYRQLEPCSPVPYLLRRAQKLAVMDFVQAVQELNLATVDSLRPSMGSAVEAPPAPPDSGSG